jgi:MFS transporter, DHA1 family, multidrug resistance protein
VSAFIARGRRWLDRWRPLLPVLIAEFVIVLGFGALLPVLPLYVVEHGVDVPTLGLITAAWAFAKLIFEPIFGYLADRWPRKPFMLVGLILLAIFTVLPLVFTSALSLFILRFLSGAAAGMYDPAARGIIVDATHEGERGEAFGLYSAFQMGGLLVGPVIGAAGAALGGGFAFPFILTGVLTLLAAGYLAIVLPGQPVVAEEPADAAPHRPPVARENPFDAAPLPLAEEAGTRGTPAPLSALLNRPLAAAIVMNFGFSLAFGVYEVIWTLYMTNLGASIGWVGVTFTLFGLGMVVVSPIAGRLIDKYGAIWFTAAAGFTIVVSGALYAIATEPVFASAVVPFEAVAEAFLVPALFAIVAQGTPAGRSSTAQGIFGAAGTVGLIVATLAGGILWEHNTSWPFWFFVIGASICLVIGLAIYRQVGRDAPATEPVRLAGT